VSLDADPPLPGWIRRCPDGLALSIRVTPRAARSGIKGIERDAAGRMCLAVRVNAPPADGRANAELLKLLARRWRVGNGAVRVVSGAGARQKVVHLAGDPDLLLARIAATEDAG
jgi:uncharacterized protein (TIGR00251 family)